MENEITKADLDKLRTDLNQVIAGFQRDLVQGQVRLHIAWNALNAVLRAFHRKGWIDEKEIETAGAELMAEAKKNLAAVREAAERGERVTSEVIAPTPLDEIRKVIKM